MNLITLKITKANIIEGYLSKYCENLFEKYNFKEKNIPERMVFETEIWMVGEKLRQEIAKLKKNKINQLLIDEVLKIVKTDKYKRGRESFVMTLHYFGDSPLIKSVLGFLLDDKQLYGFAIKELNKIKCYDYLQRVKSILENEKNAWIKKEAERYLKNGSV